MKTLQAEIPELLLQEVAELAAKQKTTVDQIVSLALAAQVNRNPSLLPSVPSVPSCSNPAEKIPKTFALTHIFW